MGSIVALVRQLDISTIAFLNGFSQHSWLFDSFINHLDNPLIKSAPLVAALWWQWCRQYSSQEQQEVRERVILAILVSFVSIVLARFLALSFYRARPFVDPTLQFIPPFTFDGKMIATWSSFPSDHVVLFSSLAMSLWYTSKRVGLLAFAWVFFIIGLPRMYLGIHYPTDILAGFLIGMGLAWVANAKAVRGILRNVFAVPAVNWSKKSPKSFYACFFLVTYETANTFDQIRSLAAYLFSILKHF